MIQFSKVISESIKVKKELTKLEKKIYLAIDMIFNSINNSSKVLVCGNGGSAADAQHLSAEFVDRLRQKVNRKPMPI